MLKPGAIVEFDRKKQFKHIKVLGVGGTGDAHLFEDETTDMLFAFKKYSPKDSNFIEEHYDRFVDEIKILFKISHPNIVRVYNYYLYPEFKLGYLQMEYIDGEAIDEYNPDFSYKNWEDIFTEVVLSFEYLEYKNILHRDIRPANILIDKNHNVKIIDFGFGKKLENKGQNGKSVLLNWPVTQLPDETAKEGIYNHKTEIFFLGKLFQNILGDDLVSFKFEHIIMKMIEIMPAERYSTFIEVSQEISKGVISDLHKTLYNRLKDIRKEAKFTDMTSTLQIRYNGYEPRYYKIQDMVFVPIYAQRHKTNLCFSQDICNYTVKGREKIHQNLKAINKNVLSHVMKNFIPNRTIEYNDNRISKFISQYGRCAVTGTELGLTDWHCHHKSPFHLSKDDKFSNLIVLNEAVHRLIHLKDIKKIKGLLNSLQLDRRQKEKVNELRKQCKNDPI